MAWQLLHDKLYYLKLDDDTVVQWTLLHRFLATLHMRLHMASVGWSTGPASEPPPIAFGNSHKMGVFEFCEEASSRSRCGDPPVQTPLDPRTQLPAAGPAGGSHGCLRGASAWWDLLRDAAASRSGGDAVAIAAELRRASNVEHVRYPAGMLYGLSRAALRRLIAGRCIERVATTVTCTGPWPSPLLEDAALGMCLHLHAVPLVQCDCFGTNFHRPSEVFRCGRPMSVHPVKNATNYPRFHRLISERAGLTETQMRLERTGTNASRETRAGTNAASSLELRLPVPRLSPLAPLALT